jgi:hypothetical protein
MIVHDFGMDFALMFDVFLMNFPARALTLQNLEI